MAEIGRLERLPLREVWKHEALDFTRWLQDNVEILNEALALNLSNVEREQSAGSFNVDLVAEDDYSNTVIIENQLEKSDHDHLGKLITYLTALGARIAIWIVADPRPEHVRAISWLNESSSADFYLLKVEAIRIGDSPPAPLLTLITGPSEETREVKAAKQGLAERHILRQKFWIQLLAKAKELTPLHANISPSKGHWVAAGSGVRGVGYSYVATMREARVELYIDRGKAGEEENLLVFEKLKENQEAIESIFGEPLSWQRLENRRACRIAKALDCGGLLDDESWSAIQETMIDAMMRLEKAIKPHLPKL